MNVAIICAGGNGDRMKTKENKIFLKLNGKPIIYYTLKSFSEYEKIDAIIVTVGDENVSRLREVVENNRIQKVMWIEPAFATRQESTFHVLEKLKRINVPSNSYVIIHNAVNPFVKHSELDQCLDAAYTYGASLLGFPATDTVKIVDDRRLIDRTPDRENVWIAQTPQIIHFEIAVRAFEHASERGFIATDDSTLVEAIHQQVKFIECSRENFKITYPHDLDLARRIHSKRVKENHFWYA
jgi:2-C-methyl-D-erythritol 4-phosphate cytidylyltransferase